MAEAGPEAMSEETVLNKGETAFNLSDSVADKWISHKSTSVMWEMYRIMSNDANESFFARPTILLLFWLF